MDNHPAGRYLPKKAITNMNRIRKLGRHKRAPSGMDYESENCHTLPYKNQEIETRYNLRPPSLIESEYESDSDMEADATAGGILNYRSDTALGTVKHAPGRA